MYKDKYLKYKSKYLDLKKKIGGVIDGNFLNIGPTDYHIKSTNPTGYTDVVFDFDETLTNKHVWNWMVKNAKPKINNFIKFEKKLVSDNIMPSQVPAVILPEENFGLDNSDLKAFLDQLRLNYNLHISTKNCGYLVLELLKNYGLDTYFTTIHSEPTEWDRDSNIGNIYTDLSEDSPTLSHISYGPGKRKVDFINNNIIKGDKKVLFIDDSQSNYPDEDTEQFISYRVEKFRDIMTYSHRDYIQDILNGKITVSQVNTEHKTVLKYEAEIAARQKAEIAARQKAEIAARLKVDEARKKEDEARKKVDEARKKEDEAKQKAEVARQKEAEIAARQKEAEIAARQKAEKIKLVGELKLMNKKELIEFLKKHGLTEEGYTNLKNGKELGDNDMGSYGCDNLIEAINEAIKDKEITNKIQSIDNYEKLDEDESPSQHDICIDFLS